jgi:hypothetical protein
MSHRLIMQQLFIDLVPLFIRNHYMFRSLYKAIFRWILDTMNIYMPFETIITILDIRSTYQTQDTHLEPLMIPWTL